MKEHSGLHVYGFRIKGLGKQVWEEGFGAFGGLQAKEINEREEQP